MYNVMYYPFTNEYNKYISISQEILLDCGCNIVPICSFRQSFSVDADVVILNWYDSINYSQRKRTIVWEIIIKLLKLVILRLRGAKIINTFHNKIQHNSERHFSRLALMYTKMVMLISNYVIILSENSVKYLELYLHKYDIEKKVIYIPHPNYIGAYSNNELLPRQNSKQFNVLFVGQIRPYKNIEIIIKCAKELSNLPIIFKICGMCPDIEYKNELLRLAEGNKNIDFDFEFVSDNILSQLIYENDILLLPYDIESSMNSGTVILAFSNATQVICPRICTIDEYEQAQEYSYCYESNDEHLEAVIGRVKMAFEKWNNDRDSFYQSGTLLKKQVEIKNSKELITELYRELLEKI